MNERKYFIIEIGEGEYDDYYTYPVQVWDITNSTIDIEKLTLEGLRDIIEEFHRESGIRKFKALDSILYYPVFKDWLLNKYNILATNDDVYYTTI